MASTSADASYLYQHREEVSPRHNLSGVTQLDGGFPDLSRVANTTTAPQGMVFTPTNSARGAPPGLDTSSAAANESASWRRMNDIKSMAAKDKEALLLRVEELSQMIRGQQREMQQRDDTLQRYRKVLGPLNEFSTKQVQLREEIVMLRDNVRQWQDKESEQRQQVQELQRALRVARYKTDHDTAESRLSDLEDRLSFAYLQKHEVETELEKINDLALAQKTHNEAMDSVQASANQGWRLRGKQAELQLMLQRKQEQVESLQRAVDELAAVAGTTGGKAVGEMNRKCPGCGEPQWTHPFCPQTGHRHLGFGKGQEQETPASPVRTQRSGSTIPASAAEAIERGLWRKLVQIGTFDITYQDVETGAVVQDLDAELQRQREEEDARSRTAATRDAPSGKPSVDGESVASSSMPPPSETDTARQAAIAAAGSRPSLNKEINALIEQLRSKTEENKKLRGLLKAVAKSGMTGASANIMSPYMDAARQPMGQADGSSVAAKPAADATPSAPTREPVPALVSLGEEDEASMPITKIQRLEGENALLNQRCTELVLELAKREEDIIALNRKIDQMRFQDIMGPGGPENTLRVELATMRENLFKEQRRVIALEDEIRRLSKVT